MKSVMEERERLRAAQRANLSGTEARLRDKKKPGLYNQIVEVLNLRKVFEAESSRETAASGRFPHRKDI